MLKYFMHSNVLCLKFKVHLFVRFEFKLTTPLDLYTCGFKLSVEMAVPIAIPIDGPIEIELFTLTSFKFYLEFDISCTRIGYA
jgi:hypothetical protein